MIEGTPYPEKIEPPPKPCEHCGGRGIVRKKGQRIIWASEFPPEWNIEPCPKCGGKP